jgi:AAA domain (dynein-related subfamily)
LAAERVDALTQGTDAEQSLDDTAQRGAKRRRVVPPELLSAWRKLHARTQAAQRLLARATGASDDAGNSDAGSKVAAAPVFAFVEGALVSALRDGSWLLLDEINLAPVETLERLVSIIEVSHTCLHASPNFAGWGEHATRLSLARLLQCLARVECSRGQRIGSPLTAIQKKPT